MGETQSDTATTCPWGRALRLLAWLLMSDDDQDALFPGFAAFRDDDSSRFSRSHLRAFSTSQKTAAEITSRLSRVVFDVTRAAARRPLPMGLDDLLRWHTGIFKTTFPYEAGQIRTAQTQFGVRWREDGELRGSLVLGSEPGLIQRSSERRSPLITRSEKVWARAALSPGGGERGGVAVCGHPADASVRGWQSSWRLPGSAGRSRLAGFGDCSF